MKIKILHSNVSLLLDRALERSSAIRGSQAPIVKMLESAVSHFKTAQLSQEDSYASNIKEGLGQLVQLHRVYAVDKYKVFFCSQDRTVWIQEGGKAENPVHPHKYKNCGKAVK